MRFSRRAPGRGAVAMLLAASVLSAARGAGAGDSVAQAKPSQPTAGAANTNMDAARQAYDRGHAAFDAGRYPEAAKEFARADELAPNPTALESAIKAATLGDQAILALELSDRADSRTPNEAVAAAARKARERFAASAGRLSVRCRAQEQCGARVDGESVQVGAVRWVLAGTHSIEIDGPRGREAFTAQVAGGAAVAWEPPPPPELPPGEAAARRPPVVIAPPADKASGISPAFFWLGLSATAVAAGFTVWSGIDTLDQYGAFQDGDDSAETSGKAAQLRTNVLLGVTGVLAVGTVALGIWAVDWGPKRQSSARVSLGPSGVSLRVQH